MSTRPEQHISHAHDSGDQGAGAMRPEVHQGIMGTLMESIKDGGKAGLKENMDSVKLELKHQGAEVRGDKFDPAAEKAKMDAHNEASGKAGDESKQTKDFEEEKKVNAALASLKHDDIYGGKGGVTANAAAGADRSFDNMVNGNAQANPHEHGREVQHRQAA